MERPADYLIPAVEDRCRLHRDDGDLKIRRQDILDFYRHRPRRSRLSMPGTLTGFTLTNTALGLGDTVVITDLARSAHKAGRSERFFSFSKYFEDLALMNPYHVPGTTPFWVAADQLKYHYNLGNGHFIQRLQRAFGLEVEFVPRGCVIPSNRSPRTADIVLHFEAGAHAAWQRINVHRMARELYPRSRDIIQGFIDAHPQLVFAEIGAAPSGFRNVDDWTGLPLQETASSMANCEYFLGIMSGPLHLAAALGLKIITIVNFPPADAICLPTLVDIDQVESEWFYPQSVLLHQEGDGPFVPRLTETNLIQAVEGDVYPYWSHAYLDLIENGRF